MVIVYLYQYLVCVNILWWYLYRYLYDSNAKAELGVRLSKSRFETASPFHHHTILLVTQLRRTVPYFVLYCTKTPIS